MFLRPGLIIRSADVSALVKSQRLNGNDLVSRVWSGLRVVFVEDLVGGLGQAEWFAALVVGADERADRHGEIVDAGEGATAR
jgi:hypothetical protein